MNTLARRRRAATSPLSRRQLLAALGAVPAIGALLAACGDRTGTDAGSSPDGSTAGTGTTSAPATGAPTTVAGTNEIAYDTSPDAVVVRVSYEGGFVPIDHDFVRQPSFLLAGDGRAFTPAPTTMQHPGPLVAPYTVRVLTPEGIQALLALAASKGLLGEIPDYDSEQSMQVADAPATVVTITASGTTYRHVAMALGIVPDEAGREHTPARQALWEFAQAMSTLDGVVPAASISAEGAYVPSAYRFRATRSDAAEQVDTGEQVDTVEPVESVGSDGTLTDRADAAPPESTIVDWPPDAGVTLAASTECGVVRAAPVAQLFADANSATRFREGDAVWSLTVAAVIPGDVGCAA